MKQLRRILPALLAAVMVFCAAPARGADAEPRTGRLDIDGRRAQAEFLVSEGRVFVPLRAVVTRLPMKVVREAGADVMRLVHPDQRAVEVDLAGGRFCKRDLWYPLEVRVRSESEYVALDDLRSMAERPMWWDDETGTLYIYRCAYPAQGDSIMEALPHEGFHADGDTIVFKAEGLPGLAWRMDGTLGDFRLVGQTSLSGTEEFRYAAFYYRGDILHGQLLITQRKLPNGDRMVFVTGYAPGGGQVLQVRAKPHSHLYRGDAYLYTDYGPLSVLHADRPAAEMQSCAIGAGRSVDQWYLLGRDSLAIEDPLVRRAWDVSGDYHGVNAWVRPEGALRVTPEAYLAAGTPYSPTVYNVNLQASAPLLLLETLQVRPHRLLEDFVHNARFTLAERQGTDGFWRADPDAAYLNRAYGLGAGYIDTRMSVDASLFLVRYGLLFDDGDAVAAGSRFKRYFTMMKGHGLTYACEGGHLYPDYYSPRQNARTVVSLNHALYEMNYLYMLADWLDDREAGRLAGEILEFIERSADSWLTPEGDLYYGLSPGGEYYGQDYLNITYVDLLVGRSILQYRGRDDSALNRLWESKGEFLKGIASAQFESRLSPEEVFHSFDSSSARRGDLFCSYPLAVDFAAGYDPAHCAYGAYHWVKGAAGVGREGRTVALKPEKKYMVAVTKDELIVNDDPGAETPAASEPSIR